MPPAITMERCPPSAGMGARDQWNTQQILAHYSDEAFRVWFNNPSRFLAGKRPRDVFDSDPEVVVAHAQYMYEAEFFAG